MNHQVLIIGGGPAGISALLWCHSLGLSAMLLEQSATLGGQLSELHHPVLEYPGLPNQTGNELRTAFEGHLRAYQLSWRLNAQIRDLDLQARQLSVEGEFLQAEALIVATGAGHRRLGVPGEEAWIGRGLSHSAMRDREAFLGKNVCVVGGGDSAFEDALILAAGSAHVTLVHRSENFRARPEWQQKVFDHPRITVKSSCEIQAIGQREAHRILIDLKTLQSGLSEELFVEGVFVRLGIQPRTKFLQGQVDVDEAGYLLVDQSQRTSVDGVYAIGDVCRPVCFSIATAIGHGAIAVKAIAEKMNREPQPPGS